MIFMLQLLAILAACAFPAFLIRAIKAAGSTAANYTALACLSFGFIVYIIIAKSS